MTRQANRRQTAQGSGVPYRWPSGRLKWRVRRKRQRWAAKACRIARGRWRGNHERLWWEVQAAKREVGDEK